MGYYMMSKIFEINNYAVSIYCHALVCVQIGRQAAAV